MKNNVLKIGTRGSKLALYQAHRVQDEIKQLFPEISTEVIIIKTQGDKILDVALSKIGDKGLFTKELEVALYDASIDIAVHSLKDMPTELPRGLKLGAVLERGEINDAFVSLNKKPLIEFTGNEKIATSSLRRIAGLLHLNPGFNIVDIRGNVITRLEKMKGGYCDAMIMAATGLRRLGLEENITEVLSPEVMIPAVGQGAIGIEMREEDPDVEEVLKKLNHGPTWTAILAERAYMRKLQGGCQVPVGCYTRIEKNAIHLEGFVSSVDGKNYLRNHLSGNASSPEKLGTELAEKIIEMGGADILRQIRNS